MKNEINIRIKKINFKIEYTPVNQSDKYSYSKLIFEPNHGNSNKFSTTNC